MCLHDAHISSVPNQFLIARKMLMSSCNQAITDPTHTISILSAACCLLPFTLGLFSRAVYYAMASTSLSLILVVLLGLVMFAYYYTCDPLTSQQVTKSDQVNTAFSLVTANGTVLACQLHNLPRYCKSTNPRDLPKLHSYSK